MPTARALALKLGAGQKRCSLVYCLGLFQVGRRFLLGMTIAQMEKALIRQSDFGAL